MSIEDLRDHIGRLREELDREREERNYFQLERDRISTFWEITKRQLEEKKAELRNKDRELEDAEEQHQAEIKVRRSSRRRSPSNVRSSLGLQTKSQTFVVRTAKQHRRTESGNAGGTESRSRGA